MQKKTMWAVLGTLLAVMVASVALVLTVGPRTSADSEDEPTIVTLDKAEYFIVNDSGWCSLSEKGQNYMSSYSYDAISVNVVLPEGTTYITGWNEEGSWYSYFDYYLNVRNLASITLPSTLKSIGECAFYYCNIDKIEIPKSVTHIGYGAFQYCDFESIIIPASIAEMEYSIFYGCNNLTTIYCEAEAQPDGWDESWKSACDANVVWGYKAQNTVTFEANGGSAVDSQVVDYGNQATAPTSSKDGYTLVGWYTEDTLENEYDFTSAVTEDITLYAKWQINTYTVAFDSNSGSAVMAQTNIEHGSTATKPADPTKEGCTFAGWYTDEALTNAYDFDTVVTSDLTLYAKWEVIPESEPEPEEPVVDEPSEPETPVDDTDKTVDEENSAVVNADKNNMTGVIAGVSVGAAVLIVAGVTVGVVLAKKRRK